MLCHRFYTPKPDFQFLLVEDSYECKMTLPPNAAFQTITGPRSKTSHLSKQLVCLEACKKLHRIGALNDHLLLNQEDPSRDITSAKKTKEPSSGAGAY